MGAFNDRFNAMIGSMSDEDAYERLYVKQRQGEQQQDGRGGRKQRRPQRKIISSANMDRYSGLDNPNDPNKSASTGPTSNSLWADTFKTNTGKATQALAYADRMTGGEANPSRNIMQQVLDEMQGSGQLPTSSSPSRGAMLSGSGQTPISPMVGIWSGQRFSKKPANYDSLFSESVSMDTRGTMREVSGKYGSGISFVQPKNNTGEDESVLDRYVLESNIRYDDLKTNGSKSTKFSGPQFAMNKKFGTGNDAKQVASYKEFEDDMKRINTRLGI